MSFSGELAFEINVDSNHALAIGEGSMEAGKEFDIAPYGTETMHVLRAEKGFIIAGQDTDGSVTPVDLGMNWLLARDKDFLGRRSLRRPDCVREDRKQLVGLLSSDNRTVLPEGTQLIDETGEPGSPWQKSGVAPRPSRRPPGKAVPMCGHVTSSYRSACLGHPFALALVAGGRGRKGETIYAALPGARPIGGADRFAGLLRPRGKAPACLKQSNAATAWNRFRLGGNPRRRRVSTSASCPATGSSTSGSTRAASRPSTPPHGSWANPCRSLRIRSTAGEHRVYWLGPDEWLVVTSAEGAAALGSELAEALAGFHAAINDVSGGHVALCVSGVDARTVLAKGCTLDLHLQKFGPGQCARTGLAKATVLLGALDNESTYTIIVSRSFSDYLCRWLAHAARPHGVRFSMRSAIP